jgi:hypothetical protein
VAACWAAAEARGWARFAGLVAEDVVYEAPQTRERVRGRYAYVRALARSVRRLWTTMWTGQWNIARRGG